jgi:flagellar export protein FliJ
MDESTKDRTSLDIARRQESKAYNELECRTLQANEQKSQLDSLLDYRNECMESLANARDTGLTPVHVREYQLLMKHINSVVEDIEFKVNASQGNLDKAKETWHQKNEHFVKVKEEVRKSKEAEDESLHQDERNISGKNTDTSKKYYGKYDY